MRGNCLAFKPWPEVGPSSNKEWQGGVALLSNKVGFNGDETVWEGWFPRPGNIMRCRDMYPPVQLTRLIWGMKRPSGAVAHLQLKWNCLGSKQPGRGTTRAGNSQGGWLPRSQWIKECLCGMITLPGLFHFNGV